MIGGSIAVSQNRSRRAQCTSSPLARICSVNSIRWNSLNVFAACNATLEETDMLPGVEDKPYCIEV